MKAETIPAQPGYYTIQKLWTEENGLRLIKIPIVAWVVTFDTTAHEVEFPFAVPVTYDGEAYQRDALKDLVIVGPDGGVVEPFFGFWESVDEYRAHVEQTHSRKVP